jgi:hypothetical protein
VNVERETLPLLPSAGDVKPRICDGKNENWYVKIFAYLPFRKIVVFCLGGKNLLSDNREVVVFWVPIEKIVCDTKEKE